MKKVDIEVIWQYSVVLNIYYSEESIKWTIYRMVSEKRIILIILTSWQLAKELVRKICFTIFIHPFEKNVQPQVRMFWQQGVWSLKTCIIEVIFFILVFQEYYSGSPLLKANFSQWAKSKIVRKKVHIELIFNCQVLLVIKNCLFNYAVEQSH